MNCYISYICNDDYLPGIVALVKSLKYHQCKHDIIVMITSGVSDKSIKIISDLGAIIKKIDEIHYSGNLSHTIEDRYGKKNISWMTFTKINIWKQPEYEKLFYIDADMVVLQNIDSIFEKNCTENNISAVFGGSDYHKYKGIESGVLLIKPANKIYNGLVEAMNSDKYDLRMSDQTLINDYFLKHHNISYLDEKWNRLQKKNTNTDGAYIYHWNGRKPWQDKDIPNFNTWNFYYKL